MSKSGPVKKQAHYTNSQENVMKRIHTVLFLLIMLRGSNGGDMLCRGMCCPVCCKVNTKLLLSCFLYDYMLLLVCLFFVCFCFCFIFKYLQ